MSVLTNTEPIVIPWSGKAEFGEMFAFYLELATRKKAEILDRIVTMELLHPEPSDEYLYIHKNGAVNCVDDAEAMPIYQAWEDTSDYDEDELREFAKEQYKGFICFLANMSEVFND